ncbi:hypothetical protein N6H13_04670 [Paenibacillus sp. CC-CFT742]|nr:hypothetical protein [Paenibacillus sp. CC-CFT742]WJH30022.1 hypothetical protein N6H13_04670 [Paenibacillus sp. CC-CFT742]
MSFKAVELQIAVPRTSEAGRYQSEYQQRPVTDQNLLAVQTAKEAEEARQRSEAMEEIAHTGVRDGQSSNGEHEGVPGSRRRSRCQSKSNLRSIHTKESM